PGNIRDLQNTIERASVLSLDDALVVDWDLGPMRRAAVPAPATAPAVAAQTNGAAHPADSSKEVQTLEQIERAHFISVLKKTHGVIDGPRGAARLLNLKPSTARFRMKKLGIAKH